MVEEEKFFAWLDGELPPEEAAQVAADVVADPEMSRLADEHRAMTAGLRGAFDNVKKQPVPERLEMLVGDAKVASLAEARARRDTRHTQPFWAQAAALAATLAIGVFAGNQLGGGPETPIQPKGGRLIASGDLDRSLSMRLASAPDNSGPRIGLTFRDKAGAICRTFEDRAARGMACREGGDWRIRTLFQGAEGRSADYRMAGGTDSRLMEEVDSVIDGEPFDAARERAAMKSGWAGCAPRNTRGC